MSDFDYDPTEAQATSWETAQWSDQVWSLQTPIHDLGDQLWMQEDYYDARVMYQFEEAVQDLGQDLYEQSWEEWYGPVNSEGYTAYDASIGYTSTDTSFIEPASSAGSMSMISDYNTSANL